MYAYTAIIITIFNGSYSFSVANIAASLNNSFIRKSYKRKSESLILSY